MGEGVLSKGEIYNIGYLIRASEDNKNKTLRFPREEGILPKDFNIEILPEFPACLQILDSRL